MLNTSPPRSLAASWLTLAFSLAYDLVPLAFFSRIKTSLAVLAVPIEGLVGLLYWSLTLLNPALLNPPTEPGKEPFRIPFALDVSLHGLPAVSGSLSLSFHGSYGGKKKKGVASAGMSVD